MYPERRFHSRLRRLAYSSFRLELKWLRSFFPTTTKRYATFGSFGRLVLAESNLPVPLTLARRSSLIQFQKMLALFIF